jgi:predicted RNA-binding protein (virulence factor B family)
VEPSSPKVGEVAVLKVKAMTSVGTFLDWGQEKDLLLPFREQTEELQIDDPVVVFIYLDNTGRTAATQRLHRHLPAVLKPEDRALYSPDQKVDLIVVARTDLGYKAVINGKHWGVLYGDQVFQELRYGQQVSGYIKQVRPDGKIDLGLQKTGHKSSEDIAPQILASLEKAGGFLPLNDKTSAEIIYEHFGVSRKKFKMALGGLYKKRQITVDDDGIRLALKKENE